MALGKTWRRLRVVGKGVAALAVIYRRDRNLRRMSGTLWFVVTRQGLIGLRDWLIQAEPMQIMAPEPPAELAAPVPARPAQSYDDWLGRFDLLREADLAAARRHLDRLDLPDLMIVAVVDAEAAPSLDAIVASWRTSLHPRWRATVVSSAAPLLAAPDPRVAVAAGVEAIAGPVLLCFGRTRLNALTGYMLLEAAMRTGAAAVYSDHDHIDADGTRSGPVFKPQYSPEYLARCNYIGDCVLLVDGLDVARAAALPGLTRAAYDRLVTRLLLGRRVAHVPSVLFHTEGDTVPALHDQPEISSTGPSVSIVIPTRDKLDYFRACLDSITASTSYDSALVEIVIVDNNSVEPDTVCYLDELANRPRVRVVRYPAAFNFAAINNVGAAAAQGEILVFLNNDTAVLDRDWLGKLVHYARQADVGAVGCKLMFPDGSIQHAGCVAGGNNGTVSHLRMGAADDGLDRTREISLVTGACLAIRRTVFESVGGFDPILRVTWNDVKLCMDCLKAGLRNIYVADPLLIHFEAKSRGQDDTRERYVRYFSEADYTRRRFRIEFQDDRSYNPNLSLALDRTSTLAYPPRAGRPWVHGGGEPARILMLSSVFCFGYGVPLVIYQQAMALTARGHRVVLGGPRRPDEMVFPGCERVEVGSVEEAACYAYTNDVALIVSHTPPFFELPTGIGAAIPVLAYDYGEPKPEFFDDPVRSYLMEVGYQKRAAAALTTQIATISQAVKNETLQKDARVLGLANSHMPAWSEDFRPDREQVRAGHGWDGRFVVLTVCRFHVNERAYKGLNIVAALLREFPYLYPEQSRPLVWVLAGGGTPEDVAEVERMGFTVYPNVSDEVLAGLYKAADAYLSFSQWEGYNLGIGQALAMGLPTLASDIPAHREFPIETTNSVLEACAWLAAQVTRRVADTAERKATVFAWEARMAAFVTLIEGMLEEAATLPPRLGFSYAAPHAGCGAHA